MGGGKGGEGGGVESANLAPSPPPRPARRPSHAWKPIPPMPHPCAWVHPKILVGRELGGVYVNGDYYHICPPPGGAGRVWGGVGDVRGRTHGPWWPVNPSSRPLSPPASHSRPLPHSSLGLLHKGQVAGVQAALGAGAGRGSRRASARCGRRASRRPCTPARPPLAGGGGSPARPRPATPAGPAPGCKRHPHDWLTIVGTRATVRPAALWARDQSRTADTSVKTCGRGMGAAMRCGDAGWRAGLAAQQSTAVTPRLLDRGAWSND